MKHCGGNGALDLCNRLPIVEVMADLGGVVVLNGGRGVIQHGQQGEQELPQGQPEEQAFLLVSNFFVDADFYGYHLQVKVKPAELLGLPVKNLDVQFAFFSDGTHLFDCYRCYRNHGAVDFPRSMGTLHNTAHTSNTLLSVRFLRVIPADRLSRTLGGAHSAPDTFFSGLGNQTCPARLFVRTVTWDCWG